MNLDPDLDGDGVITKSECLAFTLGTVLSILLHYLFV